MPNFRTPYINIWNPICKKYQWVRIVNLFKNNQKNNYYYVVNISENNLCKCNINKFLVVTDELVFRYYREDSKFNNWINKVKIFPEPNLGIKNVYTNKYEGINMKELYKYASLNQTRYIKFPAPEECKLK
jgi:hypothetical protein